MPLRVLVVDDSVLFRTKMKLSLTDKEIQIVGLAMDATEAMTMIEQLHPDVVTLDVEMPKVDGISFLKKVMPQNPVPVVVVSSLPMNALDALSAGAVDFVRKPVAGEKDSLNRFLEELKSKIKIAAKAKVRCPAETKPSLVSQLSSKRTLKTCASHSIIAIGASTGGTEAILSVVKDLPESTPGIIVVQHMPANFTNLYAQRLNKVCKMNAKEAEDFDRVKPGQIIIAAGEYHLTLKKDEKGYYIRSQTGAKVSGHCPSVDVMFDSVADVAGKNAIGVILTGMGADGAQGITKMRKNGSYTIGQDKESCVVYGMPMEAYKRGGIERQLPLNQIGDELIYYLNKSVNTSC
ncbi:protein-glutamate methylesterase/protein-glutamine glutaminase [Scatolibacter rhodanostii]|uniref:protein-glutamate methylesterase/protein-glutamine glutaminase n=1 Tax=Scatolibacter rhodanostii TaxID=2014781 RepID=UPI000C0753F2|nr:chemotaxis response regulator protein-glutamate methylesterase [Scatolibacter rhodanostii]